MTTTHLESFAREGLRTLCCAVAEIPADVYEEWRHTYHKASIAMQNREEKLSDAANLIETNLVLLGATAIEDKLQDGVPETIEALLEADIRMWMLTGDKQETAINIGHACRLLNPNMELLVMNEDSLDVSFLFITFRVDRNDEALISGTSFYHSFRSGGIPKERHQWLLDYDALKGSGMIEQTAPPPALSFFSGPYFSSIVCAEWADWGEGIF